MFSVGGVRGGGHRFLSPPKWALSRHLAARSGHFHRPIRHFTHCLTDIYCWGNGGIAVNKTSRNTLLSQNLRYHEERPVRSHVTYRRS